MIQCSWAECCNYFFRFLRSDVLGFDPVVTDTNLFSFPSDGRINYVIIFVFICSTLPSKPFKV